MASYYFATFHQKKTIPPTCKKDIRTPKDLRDAASTARTKMVDALEHIYNNPKELASDKAMADVHYVSETYLRWAVRLVESGYRKDVYCYWGDSLCPKTNHAFNDLHYDMANVLWNLACIEMNRGNHILTFNVTTSNLEAMEKDAYANFCSAAGRYALARQLIADVSTQGSDGVAGSNYLLADITPDFLEMMEKLALAQAQEIGASKAARKDEGGTQAEKKSRDALTTKLLHQCFKMYQEAAVIATRKVVCPTERFGKLIIFLELKCSVYESLTYAYAASTTYDDKPEEGLWLLKRSTELYSPCAHLIERGGFDRYIDIFIQGVERTRFYIKDKIESMNKLVVRAKPSEGPVSLPAPQPLSRAKECKLPEPAVIATDGIAATTGDWDVVESAKSPTAPSNPHSSQPPPAAAPTSGSSAAAKDSNPGPQVPAVGGEVADREGHHDSATPIPQSMQGGAAF